MARETKCPYCSGNILTKKIGRVFATITGFLQRSYNIRIPTPMLAFLQENMPVGKSSLLKGKCKACDGKGSIKDPSDDSDKLEKVKSIAQSKIKEILELEKKLAPPCGNRYTIIQGCDLLEVGLGMNNNPSYRVDTDKSMRNKGLIDPGQIDPKKGGPQIPEGGKCNHVQGINSLASPGGHYMIKCSNKFSLVVGAQGVEISSGGPVTISGGITRLTGPEISIGTSAGRLLLEGQVVNINGKSVEIAPSDGHLFVKGTISCSGNIMAGGHCHAESSSFVKVDCGGRTDQTKHASPSDLYSGPGFWGGMNGEGLTAALKDTVGYVTSKLTSPIEAQQITTKKFMDGMRDKMLNVSYNARPWELKPTGYILPGTRVKFVGSFPCNYGGKAFGQMTGIVTQVPGINLNNFPHCHALPDLAHVHDVRVPDLDFSHDSAEGIRKSQSGVASSAPLHKAAGKGPGIMSSVFSVIGSVFTPIWTGINGKSGPYMK
jgi:hypothetical protein